MPVGLFISIAAREAISHGATSKLPKLAWESTTLPLFIVGLTILPDMEASDVVFGAFVRDDNVGIGSESPCAALSSLSELGLALRLFLGPFPPFLSWPSVYDTGLSSVASENSLSDVD